MGIKDFKGFVGNREREAAQRAGQYLGQAERAMNVPIVGQAPAQIRDAVGRVLEEGDFIVLQATAIPPFRVQEIVRMPDGTMRIKISATTYFVAPPDLPQVEFARIMTKAEVEAAHPPSEKKQDAEEVAEKPSLGDA